MPSSRKPPRKPPPKPAKRNASVYVHFPYCLTKCPYCDFVSYRTERSGIDHRRYANAVIAELEARMSGRVAPHAGSFASATTIGSIFFGGGTPSLWEPEELGRVLAAIRERLPCVGVVGVGGVGVGESLEVTVECNPTSLDEERARRLRDVGVNRLSVGVQSLRAEQLQFLGRLHTTDGALTALQSALASGMGRVSADMIFGLPEQPPGDAIAQAEALAETGVGHVSCYQLTIEPRTQFGELARLGRLPLADDGAVAEAFLAIDEKLTAKGFRHYEISNYAKAGEEARHNLAYWHGDPYLGLGCGAFGCVPTQDGNTHSLRYRNETDPERYMRAALAALGEVPETKANSLTNSIEPLDGETQLRERIMLGLRIAEGFDLAEAAADLGVNPWPDHRRRAAEKLEARGRVARDGDILSIPRAAWLWADDTAARLF